MRVFVNPTSPKMFQSFYSLTYEVQQQSTQFAFQDERYIRQYREETDKMRKEIKELKTR